MHNVKCWNCDTLNRIPDYRIMRVPKCGHCGSKLDEPWIIRAIRAAWVFRANLIAVFFLAVGGSLLLWALYAEYVPPGYLGKPPDLCAKHVQPETGLYAIYNEPSTPIAWLTVTVGSDANYFVVLEDAATGAPARSFYIRAGGTLPALVPLGSYVLHYATGRSWCGADKLFGPDTEVGEAVPDGADRPQVFTFERTESDTGFSQSEYKVWLTPQPNGNMKTKGISRAQFWHG